MTFPVFIKANRSRVSISKEIREVNRLRISFERSMTGRIMGVLKKVGQRAAAEYEQSGGFTNAMRPMKGELEQVFRAHYTEVIEKFGDRVYENRKQERFSQLVFQYYEKFAGEKIRGITATTGRQILQAIRDGENGGEGVDKIAKRIREKTSGAIARARSATIARTETHAAASYATYTATKELNLPAQRKRWVSVSDGRTRDHHRSANGQEVGIDEKFIIRYRGAEIEMVHPHDGSGGAANNINCRCLAVYFSDEDALFDDVESVDIGPEELPDIPEPEQDDSLIDVFATLKVTDQFVRPNKGRVTNENFPDIKRSDAKRRLDEVLEASGNDDRYNVKPRYRGMSQRNWGKIINSDDLSDDALAMVAVITDELNYLSDFLRIPRMRGYQVQSMKAIASQGDGVMNLNPAYFNRYAEDMRDDVDRLVAKKEFDDAAAKDVEFKKQIDELEQERAVIRRAYFNDEISREEYRAQIEPINEQTNTLTSRRNVQQRIMRRNKNWVLSEWTEGEDALKPFTAEQYSYAGIDHMRSTMYHEFGHHIHQYHKTRITDGGYVFDVPTERELKQFFQKNFRLRKKRKKLLPTTYSEQDEKEFFAEQFSLFAIGRMDKVRPEFMEFIREIAVERTI